MNGSGPAIARLPHGALRTALVVFGVMASWPSLANADPCEADLPKRGTSFTGEVRYIVDGDSLCVGTNANPRTWIEVRLADFFAPELSKPGGEAAKATLRGIAYGRNVVCRAGRRSYDRVVARCTLSGRSVGELMSERVKPGGTAYRKRR